MIKKVSIFIFAIISSISALCQTNVQIGDNCFAKGDYECAITNYDTVFKQASGKDKQIAEIKLTRAKWCAEQIKTANKAFNAKDYLIAKETYQNILGSNPNDNFAQSQIIKCDKALNPPELRKATTSELTDIWNNKYGVQPQRRQNLINAGIDPDDAQKRINNGEGKPSSQQQQETYLRVSNSVLYFEGNGGVKIVTVETNARNYDIKLLPTWCSVNKSGSTFSITAKANLSNSKRDDWFKVYAGDKEIKVTVQQNANTSNRVSSGTTYTPPQKTTKRENKCFNCPKAYYPWGISIGYVNKNLGYDDNYFINEDMFYSLIEIRGIQAGLKYEPLFKYGFGINTGIFYEYFSQTLDEELGGYFGSYFEYDYSYDEYEQHVINVPFHLEYRFNFSKYFNLFAYGGAGFDFIWDSYSSEMEFKSALEYGGGLRIGHVQFNIGQSLLVTDLYELGEFDQLKNNKYKNVQFSVSYMF